MSRKLNFIPTIKDYDHIRGLMAEDLRYRLAERHHRTDWGRPLYYRINVQLIMTQECPFTCPFCLERKNPMKGEQDFPAQLASLVEVLSQHPGARLSITGGEPGLYPEQVHRIARIYRAISDNTFLSVNTAGIDMVAVSWDVPNPVTATALERFRGYSAHEMMSETTRVIMERMA